MNQYHSSPDEIDLSEIDRLVAAMERGEITTEEEERLESLVCSNSAARQRYVLGLPASLRHSKLLRSISALVCWGQRRVIRQCWAPR
jgi:hypothetical protein